MRRFSVLAYYIINHKIFILETLKEMFSEYTFVSFVSLTVPLVTHQLRSSALTIVQEISTNSLSNLGNKH